MSVLQSGDGSGGGNELCNYIRINITNNYVGIYWEFNVKLYLILLYSDGNDGDCQSISNIKNKLINKLGNIKYCAE